MHSLNKMAFKTAKFIKSDSDRRLALRQRKGPSRDTSLLLLDHDRPVKQGAPRVSPSTAGNHMEAGSFEAIADCLWCLQGHLG
jgi:hypothetical protein